MSNFIMKKRIFGKNKPYETPCVSIRLCEERPVYSEEPLENAPAITEFLKRHIGNLDREYMVALQLDTKGRVTSVTMVAEGTVDCFLTSMRELFKAAILANAASIVIAHNHPSGVTEPSTEDIVLTKRAAFAGDLVGIRLVDHVIVSGSGSYSFAASRPDVLSTRSEVAPILEEVLK